MHTWIDGFPIVILILHLLDKWFLSKGNLLPVYVLTLIGGCIAIVFNILLVISMNGAHSTVLSFCISSIWTMIMAVKGLYRLWRLKDLQINIQHIKS